MKTLNSFVFQLQEKRSHADKNDQKESVLSFVENLVKTERDSNTFLTMLSVPKLGFNPINLYDTPTGIYSYPLKEYSKKILKQKSLTVLPYQSDAPYVLFFQIREGSSYRVIDIDRYSQEEFVQDAKTLKSVFEKETKNTQNANVSELEQNVQEKQKYLRGLAKKTYVDYLKFVSTSELGRNRNIAGKLKNWSDLTKEVNGLISNLNGEKESAPHELKNKIDAISLELEKLVQSSQKKSSVKMVNSLSLEIEEAMKLTSNHNLIRLLLKARDIKEKVIAVLKKTNSEFSLQTSIELQEVIKNIKEILKKLKALPNDEQREKEILQYESVLKDLNVLYLKVSNSSLFVQSRSAEETARKNSERLYSLANQLTHHYRGVKEDVKSFSTLIDEAMTDAEEASAKFKENEFGSRFRQLWYLSGKIANEIAKRKLSRSVNIWTTILLKELNIGGVIDCGYGIIHENEPTQSVFFTNKILKTIKILSNKNYRKENSKFDLNEKNEKEIQRIFGASFASNPTTLKDLIREIHYKYDGTSETFSISSLFSNVDFLKKVLDIILKDQKTREYIRKDKLWICDLLKRNYKITEKFLQKYGKWWRQILNQEK